MCRIKYEIIKYNKIVKSQKITLQMMKTSLKTSKFM